MHSEGKAFISGRRGRVFFSNGAGRKYDDVPDGARRRLCCKLLTLSNALFSWRSFLVFMLGLLLLWRGCDAGQILLMRAQIGSEVRNNRCWIIPVGHGLVDFTKSRPDLTAKRTLNPPLQGMREEFDDRPGAARALMRHASHAADGAHYKKSTPVATGRKGRLFT